mmetsp:Transcript_22874/g.75883  ORF Transcript_22874/g.75883 Transcript_22874/m.75883 type:complete len:92 (+) Transcript_22874:2568-2843(+)
MGSSAPVNRAHNLWLCNGTSCHYALDADKAPQVASTQCTRRVLIWAKGANKANSYLHGAFCESFNMRGLGYYLMDSLNSMKDGLHPRKDEF